MSSQPRRRLLLATVIAGVVMNALDGLVNGVLFLGEFRANAVRLGLDPAAAFSPLGVFTWITLDFVFAFVLAWVYGALRLRDARGVFTALKSAAALYVPTTGVILGFGVLGMLTGPLLLIMATSGLVVVSLGAIVAGWAYE
jgi:hypothetical protein